MPTDRLGALARLLLGRLLVVAAQLHLTEDTLALHLLLQGAQGLVDVVVANGNLHGLPTPFVSDLGTANGSQCPSPGIPRSEEHTSELQSLMRISYAVFCLQKKKPPIPNTTNA